MSQVAAGPFRHESPDSSLSPELPDIYHAQSVHCIGAPMIIFAIMEQRQAEQLLATERRASECGARSAHQLRRTGNGVTLSPRDPLSAAPIVAPMVSTARRIGSASRWA